MNMVVLTYTDSKDLSMIRFIETAIVKVFPPCSALAAVVAHKYVCAIVVAIPVALIVLATVFHSAS
jgi:hypothetical protein